MSAHRPTVSLTRTLLLCFFSAAVSPATVSAGVLSIAPTIDGIVSVSADRFGANFSARSNVSTLEANYTYTFSGGTPPSDYTSVKYIAIEFSLAGLPSAADIIGAKLYWYGNPAVGNAYIGDGRITSNDFGTPNLGQFTVPGSPYDPMAYRSGDVTPLLLSAKSANAGFIGFFISYQGTLTTYSPNPNYYDEDSFNTKVMGRLAADPNQRPYLEITTVPEASAFSLVSIGIGGLAVGRRIRRSRREQCLNIERRRAG
jgi:hypothetical protein